MCCVYKSKVDNTALLYASTSHTNPKLLVGIILFPGTNNRNSLGRYSTSWVRAWWEPIEHDCLGKKPC